MSIDIRPARAGDRPDCLRMIAALTGRDGAEGWPATFDTLVAQERGEILVAEDAGVGLLASPRSPTTSPCAMAASIASLKNCLSIPRRAAATLADY